MSIDDECCESAAEDGWEAGWEEGSKFMLRSIAELIGNGHYDAEEVWNWISKEMKKRNFGTWETDRGVLGFHIRIDEK